MDKVTIVLKDENNLEITETATTTTVKNYSKAELMREKTDWQINIDSWNDQIPKAQARIDEINLLLAKFEKTNEPE